MAQTIPTRPFGRSGVMVSALGFGGHHLGDAENEETAVRMVREAVHGGITFFDNCWEYHRGKTEQWMGKGLKGLRDKVFLMTKVCTHGRDKDLAMRMLDESLRRLQTDHLDLWQVLGVTFDNDPELFIRPRGAAEALFEPKSRAKYGSSDSPGTRIRQSIWKCWRPALHSIPCRCRSTRSMRNFAASNATCFQS